MQRIAPVALTFRLVAGAAAFWRVFALVACRARTGKEVLPNADAPLAHHSPWVGYVVATWMREVPPHNSDCGTTHSLMLEVQPPEGSRTCVTHEDGSCW